MQEGTQRGSKIVGRTAKMEMARSLALSLSLVCVCVCVCVCEYLVCVCLAHALRNLTIACHAYTAAR
jgi:hypothetical protein